MTTEFERRSLELTPEQWAALDGLAAQTGSVAPSGPTAGQASWRTFVKRVADYELEIRPVEGDTSVNPPVLASMLKS